MAEGKEKPKYFRFMLQPNKSRKQEIFPLVSAGKKAHKLQLTK